jgi:hypothetical protein
VASQNLIRADSVVGESASARVLTGSDNPAGGDSALLAVQGLRRIIQGVVYQVGTGVTTGTDSTMVDYQAGKNITDMSNGVVGEGGNVTTVNLAASSDADLKLRHLSSKPRGAV